MDFMALRGLHHDSSILIDDDDPETAAAAASDREAVEQWDPLPQQRNSGRISYGDSPRDPVKGGVEVYPLQV